MNPAIANKKSDGTKTVFRPNKSGSIPKIGVRNIPRNVNAVINNPTCLLFILKCSIIRGNEVVMITTPITPIKVSAKII